MRLYFENADFDQQLIRALAYTYYNGADIGECISTASRIKEGDFESWHTEWFETAQRVALSAETSFQLGHNVSAREAYFRASNYYRAANFFLYGAPVDPRLLTTYDKHAQTFDNAAKLLDTPVEQVKIPFENTRLPGYFFKANDSPAPNPILIINNGYDGTMQEMYFGDAVAALRRGYHALVFDGPGQGECLIKNNLYMRHDWEKVIAAVIDYLIKRSDVDPKRLVLIGDSWGGFLAPRAAAFEKRIAALIVNPGQMDVMFGIKNYFPEIMMLIDLKQTELLQEFMRQVLQDRMMAEKFRAKMWIHGVKTPLELINAWKDL